MFYGRGSTRENVFDRQPVDGPSSAAGNRLTRSAATSQTAADKKAAPKNRTGRKVALIPFKVLLSIFDILWTKKGSRSFIYF